MKNKICKKDMRTTECTNCIFGCLIAANKNTGRYNELCVEAAKSCHQNNKGKQ